MSAEKKRSNGAPFDSWAKKFPDEPKDSFTVCPVFFSNSATISLNAKFRSDAAATEISPACAAEVHKLSTHAVAVTIHLELRISINGLLEFCHAPVFYVTTGYSKGK